MTTKTAVKKTDTAASCPGSKQVWQTGGKCPVCKRTATGLINLFKVPARRSDGSLAPRVPEHPAATEAPPVGRSGVAGATGDKPRSQDDAQVLNGVGNKPRARKPAASVRVANEQAPTRSRALKAVPDPVAKAAPAKPVKTAGAKPVTKDPLTKPFTATIRSYLVWLEKQTGPFSKMDPTRLAGLAISMYGKWQVSPERIASREEK